MTRFRPRAWLCCVAFAACHGAPAPAPAPTGANAPAGRPGPAAGAPATNPAANPNAPGVVATSPARSPQVQKLGNGATLLLWNQPGSDAWLSLQLAAGSEHGAPGLAELAAAALVGAGDAARGRPGLQAAITACGGTLSVDVGPRTTAITARVPAQHWRDAQRAFAAALAAPPVSRSQLERIREELVMRRIAAMWTDREREATRAFLLGESGTADYLADLLDRDVGEVVVFLARACRPELTTFAARTPAGVDDAARTLGESLGTWQAPPQVGRPAPAPAVRRLQAGVHWAPAPPVELCAATVILPLPGLLEPDAAEQFVMHALVTQDGVGGRLGDLLRSRGLGHVRWRARFVQFAETGAVALTADSTPAETLRLWQCVDDARRSLRDRPPTSTELDAARRRAALTARLAADDGAAVLRQRVALAVAGEKVHDPVERLDELAKPGAFDVAAAVAAYLARPTALVVFGGEIPAGAAAVRRFDLLPSGAYARLVTPDPKAQVAAAAPVLDGAMQAVGGADLLRRFSGCDAVSDVQGARTPPVVERLHWVRPAEVTRQREVLGGVVETKLADGKATEALGKDSVELDAAQRARLLRELDRHPLALLAACARGELAFRPVSKRNVGDRDLVVLEAVTDHFDRLRIHLDATSRLIRVVEVWETTADGVIVHQQEAWSDYRSTGGLRAPFRKLAEQDDGENRVETVHRTWKPAFAVR